MSAGRAGIPFVVAAPSGTGKTTVCRRVVADDERVDFSISHTTRERRQNEADGVDYHFVTRREFAKLVADGAFLESAEYNGNLYGTSWAAIEGPLAQGHDVLLEIEVQGAAQVRRRRADARFVFLLPPSLEVLRRRLTRRETDDADEIAARLVWAERVELDEGTRFDYAVVNDDLDRCVAEVLAILQAERSGETGELRRRLDPVAAIEALRGQRS